MTTGRERVVLWDFDGTLATRVEAWSSVLTEALRVVAPKLGVTEEAFLSEPRVGFPWHAPDLAAVTRSARAWWAAQDDLLRLTYSDADVDPVSAELAIAHVPTVYYRPTAWLLAPDAVSALKCTAAAGYRNAILSNHAPELPTLVDQLGLGPWVDVTITSASVGAEKPSPAIFALAIHVTNAGGDTWMIGDNPIADIAGAQAVGMRAIRVGGDTTLAMAAEQVAKASP
jgi:putative hydrolase of the HAD superfamily